MGVKHERSMHYDDWNRAIDNLRRFFRDQGSLEPYSLVYEFLAAGDTIDQRQAFAETKWLNDDMTERVVTVPTDKMAKKLRLASSPHYKTLLTAYLIQHPHEQPKEHVW